MRITVATRQAKYILTNLSEEPYCDLLRESCSLIAFGSSVDDRSDALSDWDFKLLMPADVLTRFLSRWPSCHAIDDKDHSPPAFCLFRSYQAFDRDLAEQLEVNLWIYSRSRIIRDDHDKYVHIIDKWRQHFSATLHDRIKHKYIHLRSVRHALDHAVLRKEPVTITLLKSEFLRTLFELVHLSTSTPYPHIPWLYWSFRKLSLADPLVGTVEGIFAAELAALPELTRKLVDLVIARLTDNWPADLVSAKWWLAF
jgi:hypothetical protein